MILQDHRFETNTELTFLIPCYHGMKTPDASNHKYNFGGYCIWHSFTLSDALNVSELKMAEAYEALFGEWARKDTFEEGYNPWQIDCDVYFFRVTGGQWNDHGRGYSRENLKHNAHAFMAHMIEGVAASASGDDSYFDYVPSEYYAIYNLACDLNQNLETEEFLEYPRKIWDEIAQSGEKEDDGYPIEFIETYGQRP